MATVDEYLDQGWAAFESGLGSTPYAPSLERNFKSLYRNNVTWNLETITQAEVHYLVDALLPWMGEYAAGLPNISGVVTADQLCTTFEAGQLKAYHDNGDQPTKLC